MSVEFFREIFEEDLQRHKRQTFKGHYIYAMDGDHLDLPASVTILKAGFRGSAITAAEETHYPKMYTVQALDLVNGVVKKFSYSERISEQRQAWSMVKDLETNSITLYDRLYDFYQTAWVHTGAGNYFFARVKVNNPKSPKAIREFIQSNRRSQWIEMHPPLQDKEKRPSIRVRFIKVRNPRTKKVLVFMTNTAEDLIRRKEAADFYQRRWGIESNFKDLTSTLMMTKWRSKKLQGILQEIYALLWLVNNVRRQMVVVTLKSETWLNRDYRKANFKLLIGLLVENFDLVVHQRWRRLRAIFKHLIHRGTEKRRHLSRQYPRELKKFGKKYKNASRVPKRIAP